ncbi:MAG: sodium:solute symporter family protein, partial [Bacteroidota bacterium]
MQDLLTYTILGGALFATLVLGLWAGRHVKTMKDYVLAGRSLNTGVLTMTLVATFFSGVDLTAHPMRVFSSGILGPIVLCATFIFCFMLLGIFVAPKMVYFSDCLTVGDLMRKFYGDRVGLVSGVASAMVSIFITSAQSYIILHVNESLLRLPNGLILSIILLMVLYTTLGGMRAVAHTDVLQLIVGTLMLCGFASVLIYHVGGLKALFQQIPAERVIDYSHTSWWEIIRSALFVGGTFTAVCRPPVVTRMLVPARKEQVKNMFFVGSFIYLMLFIIITLMSLAAVVYCQRNGGMLEQEVLGARHLIGHMARIVFEHNQLAQVLMFVGVLFVILSTMDSFLQAAGLAVVHDVIRPLWHKSKRGAIDEVRWSKVATLCIGIIAVINSVIYMNLPYTAGDHQPVFYYLGVLVYSSVVLPMLIGILGLKTDKRSFWTFFVVFVTGTTMGKFFTSIHEYTVSLLSLGFATIMFFVSHVLINHGVRKVSRTEYSTGISSHRFSRNGFFRGLSGFAYRVSHLPQVASRKVYSYGRESMLFAIFYLSASLVLLISNPSVLATSFLSFLVYGIGLTLSVGLLCEVLWPAFLKPYFDLYWFVTLLYCVPFVSTLLFLTNPASFTSIIGIAVALILLIVCVDWQTFLLLASVGITMATGFYRFFSGHYLPVLDFDTSWSLGITLVLVLVIGLLFARRKEQYNLSQVKKAKLYAGSIAHETNNYLNISMFAGDMIKRAVSTQKIAPLEEGQNTYTIPKELAEILINIGPQLSDGARQSTAKIEMFMSALKDNILSAKRESTSVRACIEEALEDTYFQDEEVKKGLLLELDDDFKAQLAK